MHEEVVKGILSAKNGMNLYRGCTHGCIYCDSRSQCYQMNHAFEDVGVKTEGPKLLEQALRRKRHPCMIGTGAMSDPYLPLEEQWQLTRQCLELIERYGFGVTLLTKSDLVLRDLDLLRRIHQKTKCVVQMTLTTWDEPLCRLLEPGVCTTQRRVQVLETLRDAGIPTIVWLCPVLPFLNDTPENLQNILQASFAAGVKGVLCMGMGVTLRQGNREYFYQQLDQHFPGMKERYIRNFGDSYVCNSPYHAPLMKQFRGACKGQGVLYQVDKIFAYLNEFEDKQAGQQLSLFGH